MVICEEFGLGLLLGKCLQDDGTFGAKDIFKDFWGRSLEESGSFINESRKKVVVNSGVDLLDFSVLREVVY